MRLRYHQRKECAMAVEDFLEPEVAAAAAVTAVIASPKVRQVLRRGAVLGLAGILAAGDALSSLMKSAGRGAKQAASEIGTPGAPVGAEKSTENHAAHTKTGEHHAAHAKPTATVTQEPS
jgi:Tfp pilus assembly major pilin PilA